MIIHPISRESKFLATLRPEARVSVVEVLAAKPQGTAFTRIAQILTLGREATADLTREEWDAAGKPLTIVLTDDEAIAWGLALAAIHMMPNRERVWI